MNFLVSSEDCELLMALGASESLFDLSEMMKRDISVISRRLNKIKQETQFLEKKNGRWLLTKEGILLCDWAKKASNEQRLILNKRNKISLVTTREFSSRIFIPNWKKIKYPMDQIEIITSDGDSENLLLQNIADIAIDCGTPYHPDIRFKKIAKEEMVIVASSKFLKAQKRKNLKGEDYLHFQRNNLNNLQEELNLKLNPKFIFSDLSSLRSALLNHLGWGLIPYYVVKDDLRDKHLVNQKIKLQSPMSFGVWWKKDFENMDLIHSLTNFLKEIEL